MAWDNLPGIMRMGNEVYIPFGEAQKEVERATKEDRKEIDALRNLLRDALAELVTLAGEPVPDEQIDYRKRAQGAVDFLHQKLRVAGLRLTDSTPG